jgi:anaerobic ribonucleoside-triphosphate reductase activating protein
MAKLTGENVKLDIGVTEAARLMLAVSDAEGITISGGEPFIQAEALAAMLRIIKSERNYGVIIYTGFLAEELSEKARKDRATAALLEAADIIVDGPYVADLDDGKPYRGSSNQRIIQMTDRYADIAESYYSGDTRKVEIKVAAGRTFLVGVPSKSGISAWNDFQRSGFIGGAE